MNIVADGFQSQQISLNSTDFITTMPIYFKPANNTLNNSTANTTNCSDLTNWVNNSTNCATNVNTTNTTVMNYTISFKVIDDV
jgi:hypothetical protein